MVYAETIYMDSGSTYPAGEQYDRLVVLEDVTFSTFSTGIFEGNTSTEITVTEISFLSEGTVFPGPIQNIAITSGKILLSRG